MTIAALGVESLYSATIVPPCMVIAFMSVYVDNYFVHGKKADDKDIIVIDHNDGSKHDGKERNLQRKVKVGHIQIPRVK